MDKNWTLLFPAPPQFLSQFPELPIQVANLLYQRGLDTQEKIDQFLDPDYSTHVHDPFLFNHMERAVSRIFDSLKNQEKITVHGDYDADGVCSAVILVSTLKALGIQNVNAFLPHREIDGYGLNKYTVQLLAQDKTNLIITCDCGISNGAEIALANELGMEVIITDHHTVPAELPQAHAIIHPLVPGEKYPDKGLAGGGVAFKLAQALLKKHKEANATLPNGDLHEAFEKWLLDLVAIASVGDMVPLLGESRTLTKYGLVVLNITKRLGLQKLLLEARLIQENDKKNPNLDSENIGFQIAPRINAAGRMEHANTAYELLMAQEPEAAAELAYQLDQNNQERQKVTENLVKQVVADVEENQIEQPIILFVGQNWPTGIVGLIAGRIKEKYYKPTIIMAENEGEITGSGRSIAEFNLISALQEISQYFSHFGGHPMACGFTLSDVNKLSDFKQSLIAKFNEKTAGLDISPTLKIDSEINLAEVDWQLYDLLCKFEPFGQANERPKYLAKDLIVINAEPVGKNKKHLRLMVKTAEGTTKKMVGWNLCNGEQNWCKILQKGDKIEVVFEISVNEWNGNRELQLTIVDLRKAENTDDADFYADNSDNADDTFIYGDLTYKINGILFKVHNEMLRYANEKQICDAIEELLKNEKLRYEREKMLPPSFLGEHAGRNRIDFIIENKVVLEVKLLNFIGKEEYYQCLRYLEALDRKLCLLINFRSKQLKIKRIINPKAKT